MRMRFRKPVLMWIVAVVMVTVSFGSPAGIGYAEEQSPVLTEEWVEDYGSSDYFNVGKKVKGTSDSGFVILGQVGGWSPYINKLVVIKTDSNGNLEWQEEYFDDSYMTKYYSASDIQETDDGGFIIGGTMFDNNTGTSGSLSRPYLLKLTASGQIEWSKSYGQQKVNNQINSVKETKDGGYIAVANFSYGPNYIMKVDKDGNIVWDHYFNKYATRSLREVTEMEDGGFLVAGIAQISPSDDNNQPVLVKYDSAGNVSWHQSLSHPNVDQWEGIMQLEADVNGDGYLMLDAAGLWKLDRDGKPEWYKVLIGDENRNIISRSINHFKQVTDGLMFTGREFDYSDNMNKSFHLTIKTDHSGNIQWSNKKSVVNSNYLPVSNYITADGGQIWLTFYKAWDLFQIRKFNLNTDDDTTNGTLYLDSEDYSLSINTTLDIQASFHTPDGSRATVTEATYFTIDNPSIATIDASGNITGLSPGLTQITAEYQGHRATATLLVVRPYVMKEHLYVFP